MQTSIYLVAINQKMTQERKRATHAQIDEFYATIDRAQFQDMFVMKENIENNLQKSTGAPVYLIDMPAILQALSNGLQRAVQDLRSDVPSHFSPVVSAIAAVREAVEVQKQNIVISRRGKITDYKPMEEKNLGFIKSIGKFFSDLTTSRPTDDDFVKDDGRPFWIALFNLTKAVAFLLNPNNQAQELSINIQEMGQLKESYGKNMLRNLDTYVTDLENRNAELLSMNATLRSDNRLLQRDVAELSSQINARNARIAPPSRNARSLTAAPPSRNARARTAAPPSRNARSRPAAPPSRNDEARPTARASRESRRRSRNDQGNDVERWV